MITLRALPVSRRASQYRSGDRLVLHIGWIETGEGVELGPATIFGLSKIAEPPPPLHLSD
jgi:hypothetical protein